MNTETQAPSAEDIRNSINGFVLAGGQGLRMNGQDKGLIEWQGQRLAQRLAEKLEPQVAQLAVNCNRNQAQYQAWFRHCISDELEDFQGPLAGIAACLNWQFQQAKPRPYACFVPCDSTELPADLVQRLYAALEHSGKPIAIASDGEREQYLFCLMRSSVLSSLQDYLLSGQRSVGGWLQQLGYTSVIFAKAEGLNTVAVNNINRIEQLSTLDESKK